ncbi:putative wall-associated receptor kinase-like 16 isoform X2 [Magnolia sinica]|uniref:putative wall-associated receptor kinase-like 16 isoform X2 n=1 Tax=Magnolia sinica TaxID=86752 RepID=UPI00265B4AE9|nr:putative wall-associated receptor kinase-like 16 isoform X2 [Magnolia sinica]
MGFYLLLQLFCLAATIKELSSQHLATISKPGCAPKCGNVHIPYPFGIGEGCHIGMGGFNISCNHTFKPPKPFWGEHEVVNISLASGIMKISNDISYECYNKTGGLDNYSDNGLSLNENHSFTFSQTLNKFIAIGCNTVGMIDGSWVGDFVGACPSLCITNDSPTDGTCSGAGCCQTDIPKVFKSYLVEVTRLLRRNDTSFSPCSFAFLGEKDAFSFKRSDLNDTNFLKRNKAIPVVVDWAIGNETCEIARKNSATFACVSENSYCYNSTNGPGYRCNCSDGFRGSPYLHGIGGCQDINECEEDHQKTLCQHDCINLPGNYSCSCPKGYHGLHDDKRECIKDTNEFPVDHVVLGIGLSLLFLLIGSPSLYWVWRKRKLIKLKEKFFQQNGGLLLQEKISSCQSSTEPCKIYTTEELEKATKNYDKNQIVGQGGYGTVYKGILPDKRIVAVKKSKIGDESQIEQFINEIHILSQINHRNIVKLVGCCLEAEVPILVYEFISNGTLSQHIHDEGRVSSISLENRLRIAAETAGALYYLHSAASTPIFHRDVKSANILLDDNFTAKVSDFGASRLVPLDHTRITTLVMGTWGYLDPEYHQTGQLTGKSDVYSFGVVLVELLTGEGPVSSTRSQVNRSLSSYFLSSMKENRIFEILAEQVQEEGTEEQLIAVARLAERCLKLKGEERPTMKEVVVELEGLRRIHEHPREPKNREETENLLGETGASQGYTGNVSNGYSVDGHTLSALEIGR